MSKARKIIQAAVILSQLIATSSTLEAAVTMTGAEQQVRSEIGYMSGSVNHIVMGELVPDPPQGLSDANLDTSIAEANYTVSASASLASVFEGDYAAAAGCAATSSEWVTPPVGADDVHGGSGPTFLLSFTTDSNWARCHIEGVIEVNMVGDVNLYPGETFVNVRLLSSDGNGVLTVVWEAGLDGTQGQASMPINQAVDLSEQGQEYVLEAVAESGVVSSLEYPGRKMRSAAFDFAVTFEERYCTDITECPCRLNGDINCDGVVDFRDLGLLKHCFFSSQGQPNYNCCCDLNDDGSVGFIELGIIKMNFFIYSCWGSTGNQNCPP
jgi:hypothetical protein